MFSTVFRQFLTFGGEVPQFRNGWGRSVLFFQEDVVGTEHTPCAFENVLLPWVKQEEHIVPLLENGEGENSLTHCVSQSI